VRNWTYGNTPTERALDYVREHAEKSDPESVLRTLDEFANTRDFLMNVGDKKGLILDDVIRAKANSSDGCVVVELGAYCGYSAVRIGRLLGPKDRLISIENNPHCSNVAKSMVDYAGLSEKVSILTGLAGEVLVALKDQYGVDKIDVLFIDHWKNLYLSDLKIAESTGLLKVGSVVVADNILFPGAPEYLRYVENSPKYKSVQHLSSVEYTDLQDAVEVSTVVT